MLNPKVMLWLITLSALLSACAYAPLSAKGVATEVVDYKGWKNTYKLSNGLVEAYVVTDIGPRIIDFRPAGGENVFYVREKELGKSGEREFVFRGGYRLWVAPEVKSTTWVPDNLPCKVEKLSARKIRVSGNDEPASGVRKIIEVEISPKQPLIRITQRIRNISKKTLQYSAWSLPFIKLGGRAFIPLDELNPQALAEIRTINLWSYTKPTDPRYQFLDRLIVVDTTKIQPTKAKVKGRRPDESKIGVGTRQGWVAYLNQGVLYIKRFPYAPKATYPDNGSTVEVYSCQEFIECENLSPLTTIKPDEEIVYPEDWYLFTNVQIGATEDEMLSTLRSYLKRTKPIRVPRERKK